MLYRQFITMILLAGFSLFAYANTDLQLEERQQAFNQQTFELAEWLKQKNYKESLLLLSIANSPVSPLFKTSEIIQALDDGINNSAISTTSWYHITQFCTGMLNADTNAGTGVNLNDRQQRTHELSTWCQKNEIFKRYTKVDPNNAWGYLFLLNFKAEDIYNSANLVYFDKAASAAYMSTYWRRGLQKYASQLREYMQTIKPDQPELEGLAELYASMTETDVEEAFITSRILSVSLMGKPGYHNLSKFCGVENQTEVKPVTESVHQNCLQIARLLDSNKNTLLETRIANVFISKLSQAGSEEQLEAERRRIVDAEVARCLSQESNPMEQLRIYVKMLPLMETHGEIEALAIASDQYHQSSDQANEDKPSNCLLLKDIDLAAAQKLVEK